MKETEERKIQYVKIVLGLIFGIYISIILFLIYNELCLLTK